MYKKRYTEGTAILFNPLADLKAKMVEAERLKRWTELSRLQREFLMAIYYLRTVAANN